MRFITLDANNKVIGIRNGRQTVEGEIQSDTGEIGQILQPDGTFVDSESIPQETQLDRIENTLDYLFLKQEGII
ncbi:MAG: hypothetical protein JM58_16360 [Peptococcaceae bacterium BICA1-8]|nr:MAG: hypothetical protein JM58_16360 [Peptococcaceae bacterium BICA1-8]